VLKEGNFKITFVNPYWITWYLLSLVIWSLILPYFSKIKYSIIITLVISILSGYDNSIGYYLSLSRTITFFPYFLMGYFCRECHIDTVRKYIGKKYAVLGLLIVFLLIYLLNDKIDYRWFYGSYPYAQLDSLCPKYIMRIFTYVIAATISAIVLILIPDKNLLFTKLGSRTIAVYGFHGFIIKTLVKYNFFDYINSLISEVSIILLSLLIVMLLSSKFMNKITKIIIHPKFFEQINLSKI
jgi:fucose 4-O-acetylase-like acetyltransferase